jgi:hypothetical protein
MEHEHFELKVRGRFEGLQLKMPRHDAGETGGSGGSYEGKRRPAA